MTLLCSDCLTAGCWPTTSGLREGIVVAENWSRWWLLRVEVSSLNPPPHESALCWCISCFRVCCREDGKTHIHQLNCILTDNFNGLFTSSSGGSSSCCQSLLKTTRSPGRAAILLIQPLSRETGALPAPIWAGIVQPEELGVRWSLLKRFLKLCAPK